MVYGLYALSPESGLVSLRRLAGPSVQQDLIPASGDQDHAISLVRGPHRSSCDTTPVHRIPLPTSVTIAIRPLVVEADAADTIMIFRKTEAKYFSRRGLTHIPIKRIDLPVVPILQQLEVAQGTGADIPADEFLAST
jgi:hypothetical protein